MIFVVLGVSFALASAVERWAARAPAEAPSFRALPVRLLVFGLLYVFWLGVWWRPLLAGFAAVTTLAVMTAISVRKRQLIGEPLVFSDFGLLRLIMRHPDLYYTGFMAKPPFLLAAAAFLAGLVAWLRLEPAAFGVGTALALLAMVAVVIAAAWIAASGGPVASLIRRGVPAPAVERHVARWGLLTTLVLYGLRWRGAVREIAPALPPGPDGPAPRPDLVVVVQIESFTDPARLGLSADTLPGLAAARDRALLHGPLRVPSHGAFTMRSEYAVLTGLSPEALGFRQFDPYLTRAGTVPTTLAGRLREAGYATLFMHPFRPDFFGRSGVVPRLGFERLLFEEDFAGADRYGPYVSDGAMVRRILAEADGFGRAPALIVAVTMENHGPWASDRLPDLPDAADQYLRHVRNADAAIADLVAGLDGHPGRVLLCLYGDHPPILPSVAVSDQPTTDYALLWLGAGFRPEPGRERPLTADALGRAVADLAFGRRDALAPERTAAA